MNWIAWTIMGLHAAGALATVAYVGRPRDVVTPGQAALSVVINAAVIVGIVQVAS